MFIKSKVMSVFLALILAMGLFPEVSLASSDEQSNVRLETQAVTLPVSGKWGTCPWTIDAEGTLSIYPGNGDNTQEYTKTITPWNDYRDMIKKAIFVEDAGKKVVTRQKISGLFIQCSQLKAVDLSGLNTSEATDMSSMFNGCSSLTSLDLSNFNTSNVTDMGSMFAGCSSLTSLDLSNFNTSNVTDMGSMFAGCSSLTSLDLSNLNSSNVTNLWRMFADCSSLTSLDFFKSVTWNVTSTFEMFKNCASLISLDLSQLYTTRVGAGVSSSDSVRRRQIIDMFTGCTNLERVVFGQGFTARGSASSLKLDDVGLAALPDGKWFSMKTRTVMSSMDIARNRNNIADTYIKFPNDPPVIIEGTDNAWTLGSASGTTFKSDAPSELFTKVLVDDEEVDSANYTVTKGSTVIELKPEYLESLGKGEHKIGIESINGTAETNFTVKGAANPNIVESGTWGTCSWEIDTDSILTIHPGTVQDTNGRSPWEGKCDLFKKVVFAQEGENKVIASANISNLFSDATQLKSIDFAGLDTSQTENTSNMLSNCSSLTALDLSGLDMTKASTINNIFNGCEKLNTIKVNDTFNFSLYGNSSAFPGDKWFSASSRKVYTPEQLSTNRNNVADTYYRVSATSPTITMGDTSVWTLGSTSELTFKSDAEYKFFTGVQVDGTDISSDCFTAREGSTFVNLKSGYLETLKKGEHKIGIVSANGVAEANFIIKEPEQPPQPEEITSIELSSKKFTHDGTAKIPTIIVKCGERELVAGTDYDVVLPSDAIKVGTKEISVTGKGDYTGTLKAAYEIIAASQNEEQKPDQDNQPSNTTKTQQIYRLYNPHSGAHLFTTDANEKTTLSKLGWRYEDVAWNAPVKSNTPVYRLYNPNSGDHHYTTDKNEYDILGKIGWNQEKICWYSDDAKGIAIYRLFNPNVTVGTHHWTKDSNEYNTLGKIGWKQEKVSWYGVK